MKFYLLIIFLSFSVWAADSSTPKVDIFGPDTDHDGIRDDLQPWAKEVIRKYEGKFGPNFENAFMNVLRVQSKMYNSNWSDEELIKFDKENSDAVFCYLDVTNSDSDLLNEISKKLNNTIERLDHHVEVKGRVAGKNEISLSTKDKKYKHCNFQIK